MFKKKYDYIGDFFGGYAKVIERGKYGVIYVSEFGDEKAKIIVPCIYDFIGDFLGSICWYAIVKRNNKYGVIDNRGDEVVPCKYNSAHIEDGEILLRIEDDLRYNYASFTFAY